MRVPAALKVGFLGGGNIAKAMAAALVRAGVCSAADINMSARTQASLNAIAELGYGTGTNIEARLSAFAASCCRPAYHTCGLECRTTQ